MNKAMITLCFLLIMTLDVRHSPPPYDVPLFVVDEYELEEHLVACTDGDISGSSYDDGINLVISDPLEMSMVDTDLGRIAWPVAVFLQNDNMPPPERINSPPTDPPVTETVITPEPAILMSLMAAMIIGWVFYVIWLLKNARNAK